MTDVVLQLLNVESAYGPIKAIRGVSLKVRQGEIAVSYTHLTLPTIYSV